METVDKKINACGKSVLIIGDTHLPFEHPDYLEFCKAVRKKYRCEVIIHVGDELDNHAISFHDSDPDLMSAGEELTRALYHLEDWHKAFPKMYLLESNHGSLVFRKQKHHGLPVSVIKPLQEIYGTPKWTWHFDILLKTNYGEVYGCHGKTSAYGRLAREQGCSAFQGHYHGKLEVTWHEFVEHRRFNMFVGCGIDWKSLAFKYGKANVPKPVLGCGVIDEHGIGWGIKMKLNGRGRWAGSL